MKTKLFLIVLASVLFAGFNRVSAQGFGFAVTPSDSTILYAELGLRDSTLLTIMKTTPRTTYDSVEIDSLFYQGGGPDFFHLGISDSAGNPYNQYRSFNYPLLLDSSQTARFYVTYSPTVHFISAANVIIKLSRLLPNGTRTTLYDTLLVKGKYLLVNHYTSSPDSFNLQKQVGFYDSSFGEITNSSITTYDSVIIDSLRFRSAWNDTSAYFIVLDSLQHPFPQHINRIINARIMNGLYRLRYTVKFRSYITGTFRDSLIVFYRYPGSNFYRATDTIRIQGIATLPPPPQNRYAASPDSFILNAYVGARDSSLGKIWNYGSWGDSVVVDSIRFISTKNDSALPLYIWNDSTWSTFPNYMNRRIDPNGDTLRFRVKFVPTSPGIYKDSVRVYYRIGLGSADKRIDTTMVRATATLAPSGKDTLLSRIPDTLLVGPGRFPGDTVTIPINLSAWTYNKHNGIYSFQTEITYNDSMFPCIGYDSSGTLMNNFGGLSPFTIQFRKDSGAHGTLDTIRIAGASDDSLYYGLLATPKTLIKLRFRIPPTAHNGDSTALHFKRFMFNEGTPGALVDDGSIKVRVRRLGDVDKNGVIQPYDAVLVLRYVIRDTTLDMESRVAAEVSGNGEITAYDAALILMRFVGKITTFPAGDYYKRALPSNRHAELALEWGELKDGMLTLFVNAKNLAELYGYSMELSYDPSALIFEGAGLTDFTQDMINVVATEAGQVRIAAAGSEPIEGAGPLVRLTFRVTGETADENMIRLTQVVLNEEVILSEASSVAVPKTFALEQNYPNPFNPETRIRFRIPETAQVEITIYNLLGQKVRTLTDGVRPAGTFDIIWDGTNDNGVKLASGMYLYRMKTGSFVQTRKLIFMK